MGACLSGVPPQGYDDEDPGGMLNALLRLRKRIFWYLLLSAKKQSYMCMIEVINQASTLS